MDKGLLIDTNILLEIILNQENAHSAIRVLRSDMKKYLTSFSMQNIFIICRNRKVNLTNINHFNDIIKNTLNLINVGAEDLKEIYQISIDHSLDFDDAHIYFMANKKKLKIVTFDTDLLRFKHLSIDGRVLHLL